MKIIAAVLITLGLAACSPGEFTSLDSGIRSLDSGARSYTDWEKGCKSRYRWLECDGVRTPNEVNGGGE